MPSTGTFAVSIGEYVSQDDAVASYKSLLNKKLSTEKYVPKSLQVLKAGDSYVVIFSRHATEEEAAKTYKLLRINDPELTPQILKGDGDKGDKGDATF